MTLPILTHGPVKLLNVVAAEAVANEIFVDDCYRLEEIPVGAIVLDVGAFYGEFGLWCLLDRGCFVVAYEPSVVNFEILQLNAELNRISGIPEYLMVNAAVGSTAGHVKFLHRPEHPAGSMSSAEGDQIPCLSLSAEIAAARTRWPNRAVVVKMDCEGCEVGVFQDESWMDVDVVTMEWHNHDGDVYAEILKRNGYDVQLEGGGPKPRPAWDKSIGGGLLHARRKS